MMTSILAPNWASRIVVENRPQVHVMTENLRRSAPISEISSLVKAKVQLGRRSRCGIVGGVSA